MKVDCNYYFLSETALQIWQRNDGSGQKKMYDCLTAIHKPAFFRQVIFKNGKVPEHRLLQLAEDTFETTWENFTIKGMAGDFIFKKTEYTGLFYTIFKRSYIRDFEKEIEKVNAEIEFYKNHPANGKAPMDTDDTFSPRTQRALNKMSLSCKQLLIWKHIEGLSHDEIAVKKKIDRIYSIKMVSRCGRQFLKLWLNNVN
jgi:hypothetical protein